MRRLTKDILLLLLAVALVVTRIIAYPGESAWKSIAVGCAAFLAGAGFGRLQDYYLRR